MSETEAACLLRSGSAFTYRLGLRSKSGLDILAGFKTGGASLYYGDAPIYHFDIEGRWQRAFVDGVHYLKGLDATVRAIDRVREGDSLVLRRQTLPFADASDLDASIRAAALDLIDDLDARRFDLIDPPAPAGPIGGNDLRDFLERVAGWDSTAWFAHRERYLATYGVWPFLPPDCSNAVVLQATLGHREGQAFGRGTAVEHYVRSIPEFEQHAKAVRKLLGGRADLSRSIFLGGPDVLLRPINEVLAILGHIGQLFPIDDQRPVHAFLDSFDSPLFDIETWRQLLQAGLGHVTLGVESGDPKVRSAYRRTWQDQDLIRSVEAIKAAGIGLGLILLVGAGGKLAAEDHASRSIELVGRLPLSSRDLITLIDARSFDDRAEGALNDSATAEQTALIKAGLAKARISDGPRVVAYNPAKQGI